MTTLAVIEDAVRVDAGLAVQTVAVRDAGKGVIQIWIVIKPGCVIGARRIAEINAEHAARAVAAAGTKILATCVDKIPELPVEKPRGYPPSTAYGLRYYDKI